MKTLTGTVVLVFALSCNWAAAQGDSVLQNGTIKVKRPPAKVMIVVKHEELIFSGKKDARKWDNGKRVMDLQLKSDLDATRTIVTEKPFPAFDSLVNSRSPVDFNWQKYFEKKMGFILSDRSTPLLDTIRLMISVDNKGNAAYQFSDKRKNRKLTESRCMEILQVIGSWQPAHIYTNTLLKKDSTKKRTYSAISLMIIVSVDPWAED